MEEKQISERESIDLIARMIQNTQQRMAVNQGVPFVIWGYGVAATSLLIYILICATGNWAWNFLWFAPTAICYPIVCYTQRKKERNTGAKSYIDRVIGCVWAMFGIAGLIATIAMWGSFAINNATASTTVATVPIFFIMALMMGMATAITGLVVKFKTLIVCGGVTMLLSMLFLVLRGLDTYWAFAIVMLVCMALPGHALNIKAKRQCCAN